MRLIRVLRAAVLFALPLAFAFSACEDPGAFRLDPIIVSDTFDLAAPTAARATLPSALDITSVGGQIQGGRFPERVGEAEQWDLAVRSRNGGLVLLPAGAAGLGSPLLARAAVTQPITDRGFDQIEEAPTGSTSFVSDSAVVLRLGAAYVARSRTFSAGFGGCFQYAKLEALALDAAAGTVRLRVTTNQQCSDPRLVEED